MNAADRYSQQINELMKQPGQIEKKLKAAIDKYEKRIHQLKGIALLEDESDLTKLYKASLDLIDRTATFVNSAASVEKRFDELSAPVREIYLHIKPFLIECNRANANLHLSQLKNHVAYHESNIDAACLIKDDEVLVSSIRDYLQFVDREVQSEPQCLPVLLQHSASLENCLNALKSLTLKFQVLLEEMAFPIVPSGYLENSDSHSWEDEQLESFANAFKLLASIKTSHLNLLLKDPITNVVSLPMQIVLSSLERRFRYHFCGSKKTNRLDKPEWYMTQILQWIRDNDYVLTIVDRDFVGEGELNFSLRVEFMRGLVRLLLDKLEFDLGLRRVNSPRYAIDFQLRSSSDDPVPFVSPCDLPPTHHSPSGDLIENVEYFGHLIEVIQQTGARLTQLAYPSDQPNPTDILSLPEVFSRWLLLEKKLASERLNDLLSTPNAWTTVLEENPRPQCAEDFVALLQAVGLRGHQLTDRVSRTRFLRVQLSLIRLFYDRLVAHTHTTPGSLLKTVNSFSSDSSSEGPDQKTSSTSRLFGALGAITSKATVPFDPAEPKQFDRSIPVLNALIHIRDTLLLLGNDAYYVSFWEDSSCRALLQAPDPWMIDLGLEISGLQVGSSPTSDADGKKDALHNFSADPRKSGSEYQSGLNGSVFDELSQIYQKQIDRMIEEIVSTVMNELKRKSGPYIHATDSWLQPSPLSGMTGGINVDTSGMQWSSAASDMLIGLRDWLFHLSQNVHPKGFARMWQMIAHRLDDFLYTKLVLANRFTPGGAAQLRYDLSHCVFPMFSLYVDRPESLFPRTRDASILLNLLRGSAELLRDSLRSGLSGEIQQDNNPLAPLLELGVYSLTPEEAEVVLSRRALPD